MVLSALIIILSLCIDRIAGDPHTRLHPVAVLGRFIGWWGRPSRYHGKMQIVAGTLFWFFTVIIFAIPFLLFEQWAPWYLLLAVGPFLLKICFAWRSLEDHVHAVELALKDDIEQAREKTGMMVSRDTSTLDREHILSATYESASENLVDSIVAPLFYFGVGAVFGFGLALAAVYRAANTMDAMLGYRDERARLGWWSARADDLLGYIPARLTGILLLSYFAMRGRGKEAYYAYKSDARKRPGVNGGIPIALMAGGTGVMFEKPGVYRIGRKEITLEEGGGRVIRAVQGTTVLFGALLIVTLCLLHPITNM